MTDIVETANTIPDISHAPVESWQLKRIKPYPDNHKIHSKEQVETLARSIKDQGLNDPITVDKDGVIISGHGRLQALQLLGYKFAPVRHLKMLTPEQADKLRIAANKTASTEYDFEALQRELNRLGAAGADLTDIGLDDKELEMMVGELGELNDDMIADDISLAVDDFEEETREAASTVDEEETSLSKAFGFSKIPLRATKQIKRLMGHLEAETGLKGSEALVKFAEDYQP
tara:strand:+ start:1760 stop:2452 length:693 start_codon:yes stop_codon:yes gene_type:complete